MARDTPTDQLTVPTSAPDAAPTGNQPRLLSSTPELDGLRGMAILIVVFFHSSLLMQSLRKFDKSGGLGVDLFFVLSGFLITALLLREQAMTGRVRLLEFYRRRALRLLPALTVFLGAQAIYSAVTNVSLSAERDSVLSVLFYFSNTWLHTTPTTNGLGGLWSLAVEEQFYMVWPFVFLALVPLRRRLSTVVIVMTGLILAVCVHRAVLYHDGRAVLYLYTRTSTRADALLVGAFVAQLWVRGKLPKRGLTLVAWPALAWYLYIVIHGVSDSFLYRGGYTLVALAIALVLCAVLETSWIVNAFLRIRPLRTLGRVSYALYIWHLLIIGYVLRIGIHWRPGARLLVAVVLTAAVVAASWVFVEQPFLRWKARLEAHNRPVRNGSRRAVPVAAAGIVCLALILGVVVLWAPGSEADFRAAKPKPPPTFPVTTQLVTVPQLEGKNAYEAVPALAKAHLNFAIVSIADDANAGDVISQSPAAGTAVRGGTVVQLVISKGKPAKR
jgi:peptidoglycan/LPS O-acetylase OafA/YrhL